MGAKLESYPKGATPTKMQLEKRLKASGTIINEALALKSNECGTGTSIPDDI